MNKEKMFPAVPSPTLSRTGGLLSVLVWLCACSVPPSAATPLPDQRLVTETETSAPAAKYPVAMHGVWMPKDLGCPDPINYDSETLLSVGADMLGQYENTTKPLQVEAIGENPPAWRILSTFSPGTGEYEGSENIVYNVDGDTMTIDNGEAKSVFTRCK